MATDYHVVTLPNKTKVPVRDHFLRDGRKFSLDGDVISEPIAFDGTSDIVLNAKIAKESITVQDISSTSIATNITNVQPTDERLVSAGAVVQELEKIQPLSNEEIDSIFGW
jgi:hypothetical protein